MAKITVWTEAYRPWIVGGNCNAPICTTADVGEPMDIGHGMTAFVVVSPRTDDTYVAESTTGAFVGASIREVREDVAAADAAVMRKQLKDASIRFKKADAVAPELFWLYLDRTVPKKKEA